VNNIASIFEGCSYLVSIPDISKWETADVTTIEKMVKECSSLN